MKTQELQDSIADLLAFSIALPVYLLIYVVAAISHVGALESEGFGDEEISNIDCPWPIHL